MKIIITLVINLFLINLSSALASNMQDSDFIAFAKKNINSEKSDTIFSGKNQDVIGSPKRVSKEEFMYGNNRLYSLDGTLPYADTHLMLWPTIGLSGAALTFFVVQHQLQMNTIWKEQGDFKIMEDGQYALYSDKAGHIFGTYYTAYYFREAFTMIGMGWELSNISAAAVGLAYTTYVEILDGYGANWGFSPSDFYADIAGSAFFIGQHYWPFLQNFTPKFMYFPADWFGEHPRAEAEAFIDDYSSHTLWLSVNVHNLLPENAKKYWPDWLELSFGYAVRNLCSQATGCEGNGGELHLINDGRDYVYGDVKYIVALDYDLVKLLPDGCNFWNWFKQSLNFIKMPSPAVEFGSVTRFYLLYPFKINF